MPEHLKKAMDRLQHPEPKRPQYVPHQWTVPYYGKILQIAPYTDDIKLLGNKATKIIQYIVETMLYYDWSVNSMMLREINRILRV